MTERLAESRKLHKGLIFGVRNFCEFIFWIRFCLVFIFGGIMKNVWAEPRYHTYLRVHSVGCVVDHTFALQSTDSLHLLCSISPSI